MLNHQKGRENRNNIRHTTYAVKICQSNPLRIRCQDSVRSACPGDRITDWRAYILVWKWRPATAFMMLSLFVYSAKDRKNIVIQFHPLFNSVDFQIKIWTPTAAEKAILFSRLCQKNPPKKTGNKIQAPSLPREGTGLCLNCSGIAKCRQNNIRYWKGKLKIAWFL